MQRITPNLWFDDQAEAAVERYTDLFDDASIGRSNYYNETFAHVVGQPAGQLMTREFTIEGMEFVALNGGPQFEPNPSVSFIVNCPTTEEVDRFWEALSAGGEVMMPLQAYDFSERYGWCEDEFGVSWQVMYADGASQREIIPSLLFVGEQCGRAEEAMEFYTEIFEDSSVDMISRYGPDEAPDQEGTVSFAQFSLAGQCFSAMDSAHEHKFQFSEGVSFIVNCQGQGDVDRYWEALTADGGEEAQCGWLTDRFGLSWQVVPEEFSELIDDPQSDSANRVIEAMLEMKKLNVRRLKQAARG